MSGEGIYCLSARRGRYLDHNGELCWLSKNRANGTYAVVENQRRLIVDLL